MTSQSSPSPGVLDGRFLVHGLFVASCLLSVVSWYTTWQGMALYLSGWFALLASLGIQVALVLVAWLSGRTRTGRGGLVAVYVITALVSIAFSYASLHTWFSAREKPATVQRALFDRLQEGAGKAEQLLADAAAEGQRHVLALEALAGAEKIHGFVAQAQDSDPFLAKVREAVAQEARSLGGYREGAGVGVRHAAFERHVLLARQSLDRLQAARRALGELKGRLRPLDPSEQQLRAFREVYDTIPWREVEETLHLPRFERPGVPALSDFLDRTASSQEDLLLAFQELVTAPGGRHGMALLLAAFIDLIVFLVARVSAPHLAGPEELRGCAVGAVLDGQELQLFIRGLLCRLEPDGTGLARIPAQGLTPGERQCCLLLAVSGKATYLPQDGVFLLDGSVHEALAGGLAVPGLRLRALVAQA